MIIMASKYYVPSQQSSVAGFFSIFLGMAIIGSAISIPYLLLVRICPEIKLSIIITALTGLGLGWLAGLLCKVFKMRSVAVALIAITLGYVFFTYFKWIFYVSYIVSEYYNSAASYISYAPELIARPLEFIQWIITINESGTWSISSSASNVNGIFLGIIWVAEIVLIYLCILFPVISQAKKPFIESEGKWAVKYPKVFPLPYFPTKNRVPDLEVNPLGVINSLNFTSYNERNSTEITLYHSSDFTENYINIDEVSMDNRKRRTKNTTVKNLRVDYEFADALVKMFHYNK
jgi:hypothetical protein